MCPNSIDVGPEHEQGIARTVLQRYLNDIEDIIRENNSESPHTRPMDRKRMKSDFNLAVINILNYAQKKYPKWIDDHAKEIEAWYNEPLLQVDGQNKIENVIPSLKAKKEMQILMLKGAKAILSRYSATSELQESENPIRVKIKALDAESYKKSLAILKQLGLKIDPLKMSQDSISFSILELPSDGKNFMKKLDDIKEERNKDQVDLMKKLNYPKPESLKDLIEALNKYKKDFLSSNDKMISLQEQIEAIKKYEKAVTSKEPDSDIALKLQSITGNYNLRSKVEDLVKHDLNPQSKAVLRK